MRHNILITTIILIGWLFHTTSVSPIEPDQKTEFHNIIKQGDSLFKNKNFENAILLYKKAGEIDPDHYGSNLAVGMCMIKLHDYENAEKQFNIALKKTDQNDIKAYIHYNLGIIYQRRNDHENAIQHYTKAVEQRPNYSAAYNNAANSLMNVGDYKSAEEMIKKAIKIKEDSGIIYFTYGNILFRQEKIDESIEEYHKAQKYGLTDPKLYYQLSRSHKRKGEYGKALDYMKEAVNGDPTIPTFFYELGLLYYETDKYIDAAKAYKKAVSLKKSSLYYHDLGYTYYALEEYPKAIEAFQAALNIQDDYSQSNLAHIYYQIARNYHQVKQYDKALEYCYKSNKENPDDPWPLQKIGEIEFLRGNKKKAVEEFEKASSLGPDSFRLHNRTSRIINSNAKNKDDYLLAIKYATKAQQIDPNEVAPINRIAWCYYHLKDFKKAKEYIEMVKKLEPDHEAINRLIKKINRKEKQKSKDSAELLIIHPPV